MNATAILRRLRDQGPWGLIGMVVLVAIIERTAIKDNPALLSIHAANWRYAARPGVRKAVGREILCFGDSQVKFGVLPPVLTALTGKSAFNLAVTVGPAPTSYFLLRRALEAGARPSAVIVDFNFGILREGPNSSVLPYPWGDLLNLRETFDLAWSARDAEIFGRIATGALIPSCRARYEVRAHVLAALRGQREDQAMSLLVSRLNWNRNDGAQAHLKSTFPDLPPPPSGPKQEGRWRCNPINERYVERFLKLAADHRIPVYWLIAPLCPAGQAHLEYGGDDGLYQEFVKRIQARYPNLVVIDGRRPGLDHTYFFDDRHLDHDGAAALSVGIGQVLAGRQGTGRDNSRWVELSDVAAEPTAIAIEDVGQSLLDLRAISARRRR